ncbi:MAG: type II toxin-antitoxin system VapC family toxin [Hyphomicrobiales bacterium]
MTVFVDTSVWYAAVDRADAGNKRAKAILSGAAGLLTSSFVLLETWLLVRNRLHWRAAEEFFSAILSGAAFLEPVTAQDLEMARQIGLRHSDQQFSITDRTSFAMMERLGIGTAAAFDNDFAIYRFGRRNIEAFKVLR